jgi:acyl-coenzyme A thioesterase PaaI-like protein
MTYTSATLEVKFIRAILPSTGRVRAEARVINAGSRLAVVESKLTGIADGKVYASATSTCLIFEAR